jgi:phage terminase small subunit
MSVLKNPRYERFAQLLATGKSATEAHELAGFKRDRGNASRLAAHPEIQTRVQQITAIGADRAAVTVESLIKEAEEARVAAMENRQISAAVAAIKEKGILSGKRVERSERGTLGEYDWLENLSADELRAYIAGDIDIESLRQSYAATNEGTGAPRRRPFHRGPSIS